VRRAAALLATTAAHDSLVGALQATGQPAQYTLMDQVWLSPALATKLDSAFIERRTKLGGDDSDHDPSLGRPSALIR
jgi:hypothetical protein